MKVERILFPTEEPQHCEAAWDFAVSLAREHHAELEVLHVEPFIVTSQGFIPTVMERKNPAELESQLKQLLPEPEGVTCHYHVENGGVVEGIVRFAKEGAIDLIVMGTHGRRGFKWLFLGSTAEEVVRAAPCPVLSVKYDQPLPA
jgi:universal stress protein A